MKLIIGEKNWSTWSLRVWLVLKRADLDFEEVLVSLRQPSTRAAIEAVSPSGWIPVLIDGDLILWESLAICEYLAELKTGLWPSDPVARALARCAAAEMHAHFQALRQACPMDLALRTTIRLPDEASSDARRIVGLWRHTRGGFSSSGPFLFGDWSIADAFFTPVATRLRTYGVDLARYGDDGAAAAYMEALLTTPEFLEWESAALTDPRHRGPSE
jgi:glutathione S-transferase